ncbi:MAG TPA: glycosyltransferase family 4 protein [Gemmatimonadaceae bacterium]|nr:glycosyltransferase family 4 protein [Gemmatimonadaceae bacterium]
MREGDPRTVLILHNYYQQPGGEDEVFATEARLLEERGHTVVRYTVHNDSISGRGGARLALDTMWNRDSYRALREVIRGERPDIVHSHNTFPLISPAAYYAAHAEGVPVVQTLHNYRLFCVNAQFYRDGRPCEDCLGRPLAWPGVLHSCYRSSRPASAVTATMLAVHRGMGTWKNRVSRYIALTDFAREKCIAGGLPAERVVVKPNFVHPDPGAGDGEGGYALFVGRLSPEKGVLTLLRAWERAGALLPLKVVGDGPLAEQVREAARCNPAIEYVGRKAPAEVIDLIGSALCMVCPSEWYEGFPRVVVESLARGTPIIAARIGSLADVVDDGRTGMHFEPGDSDDLVTRLERFRADEGARTVMRHAARAEFLASYTADVNYEKLMEIYRSCAATS